MKKLSEYKEEIFRRSGERLVKRRQRLRVATAALSVLIVCAAVPLAVFLPKMISHGGTDGRENTPDNSPAVYVVPNSSDTALDLFALLSRVCGEDKTVAPRYDIGKTDSADSDPPGVVPPGEAESAESVQSGEKQWVDAAAELSQYLSRQGVSVLFDSSGKTVIIISEGDYVGRYVLSGNVLTLPDGRTVALAPEELAELNSILKKLG